MPINMFEAGQARGEFTPAQGEFTQLCHLPHAKHGYVRTLYSVIKLYFKYSNNIITEYKVHIIRMWEAAFGQNPRAPAPAPRIFIDMMYLF